MQESNPYSSPATDAKAAEIIDDRQLQVLAKFFDEYRDQPPSLIRLTLRWPGIPLLAVMAMICALFAVALGVMWQTTNVFYPLMLLLVYLAGAATRELGSYQKFIKLWPAYKTLIDWQKVNEIVG